jgi:GNAT superfamily N-acetyltransferase
VRVHARGFERESLEDLEEAQGEKMISYKITPNVDDDTLLVQAYVDDAVIATAKADVFPEHLEVSSINVDDNYRSQKVGTKIYEQLLKYACSTGKVLASDTLRSHFAEAFWRKQARKRRAKCVKPSKSTDFNVFETVLEDQLWLISARCRAKGKSEVECTREAEAFAKRLPKPRISSKKEPYWPCKQWETLHTACGSSLEGLKNKRRGRR